MLSLSINYQIIFAKKWLDIITGFVEADRQDGLPTSGRFSYEGLHIVSITLIYVWCCFIQGIALRYVYLWIIMVFIKSIRKIYSLPLNIVYIKGTNHN